MITTDRFRAIALSFAGTTEVPHVDRAAFRTTRRIFVTLASDGRSANVALTPELQGLFVLGRPGRFTAIPNGWGAQGWTTVDLDVVDEGSLTDALRAAHGLARPVDKKPKPATWTKPGAKTKTTTTTTRKKATKRPS